MKENNLGLVSDTELIDQVIQAVLADDAKSVADYKGGNEKVIGFFVGRIMKGLGGKADPKIVNERLRYWLTEFSNKA